MTKTAENQKRNERSDHPFTKRSGDMVYTTELNLSCDVQSQFFFGNLSYFSGTKRLSCSEAFHPNGKIKPNVVANQIWPGRLGPPRPLLARHPLEHPRPHNAALVPPPKVLI